ncbi:hypothetical protein PINS_up012404 [Pythium insidiosum]|nr:hypothetical protein PINS_up012404 [Pythium insidiosum]
MVVNAVVSIARNTAAALDKAASQRVRAWMLVHPEATLWRKRDDRRRGSSGRRRFCVEVVMCVCVCALQSTRADGRQEQLDDSLGCTSLGLHWIGSWRSKDREQASHPSMDRQPSSRSSIDSLLASFGLAAPSSSSVFSG